MNAEKAREFFSSYYEGTLEPGLQQSLSATLNRDAELLSEYREFERTYEELGKLKYEVVEIPFNLHDRIMSKLDQSIPETRRAMPAGWSVWVRNIALAGVAAAAIVGAVLSLRPSGDSEVSIGGGVPLPVTSTSPGVDATLRDGVVSFEYAPKDDKTVEIRKGFEGEVLKTVHLSGNALTSPLENKGDEALAFSATVKEDKTTTIVALPGRHRSREIEGQGNLEEFAISLAGFYRVPVLLKVHNPKAPVRWSFRDANPVTAATQSLDSQDYNVMLSSGLVSITSE